MGQSNNIKKKIQKYLKNFLKNIHVKHEKLSGFYCKILDHKLDIPLRKTNKGQQTFSFLGPKISHSTKNVKTRAFFTYVLKREILSILCG